MVLARNRYGNIQPWDSSRIRLKVPIGGSDYVNASPISLKSRSALSSPNARSIASGEQESASTNPGLLHSKYIATQGPREGQFSHFWNMVMQETVGEVGVIVMLTQCWEGNKEKCGQYFPTSMDMPTVYLEASEGDQPSNVTGDPFLDSDPVSGDADSDPTEDPVLDRNTPDPHLEADSQASVTLLEFYHDTVSRSEVRKLLLTIGDQTKVIWHYLFNGWPDYGKPEGEDRRALIELIKQSSLQAGNPSLNPRFVHCSAGVGRTGTFIALDFLLKEIAHGKLEVIPSSSRPSSSGQHTQSSQQGSDAGSVDGSFVMGKESTPEAKEDLIFEVVNTLREQRMMMVMNEVQFSFLYEALREAYVEMYSPRHDKVIGSGAGKLADANDDKEGATDADMGEPSPKVARTENIFLPGPGQAVQGEKKQTMHNVTNADAVTANNMVAQRVEGTATDPYAAIDPEVVRQEKEAKKD